MPQMAPMNWVLLFTLFTSLYALLTVKIFYLL